LDYLQCPDKKLKIIHIAGSNGKGSTAEYITQMLIAAGKKVGTFTSPPVYAYFEQFKVNGAAVENTVVFESFERVYDLAYECGATRFEVETASAIDVFARCGCEYAVLECGLGGKNDATNAVAQKELAVITSISLEHTAILGNTLEEICAQKAGIIKNCPAVVNAMQAEPVLKFFKEMGAIIAHDGLEILGGYNFRLGGEEYTLKMFGAEQCYNAATAITAARMLGIGEEAIKQGVEKAKLDGRVEIHLCGGTTYVFDGSHNPQSFSPLRKYLSPYKRDEVTIIYGCLSDKDAETCLKILNYTSDTIIAVPTVGARGRSVDSILGLCGKYFKTVIRAESVSEALSLAKGKAVVVCGSFTILREAKQWIEKKLNKR